MSNSKVILTVLVSLAVLAGTSYAIVTPGAVLEFNAQNQGPGDTTFANTGSLGGSIGATPNWGFSGNQPLLVNEGPGPLLNKAYGMNDADGNAALWADMSPSFNSSAVSIETWMRIDDLNAPGEHYHTTFATFPYANGNYTTTWWVPSGGRDDLSFAWGGGGSGTGDISLYVTPEAEWLHLVYAFDADADEAYYWMNGVPTGAMPAGGDLTFGGLWDWLAIAHGAYGTGAQAAGARFHGLTALTRIYDRILTDNEVVANMNAVVPSRPRSACSAWAAWPC